MIAIVDYGAGNLFSVKNACDYLGLETITTSDAKDLENADGIILPGVGAFADAMEKLEATGLIPVIKEQAGKSRLLASALECRCCLITAQSLEKPKVWVLFPDMLT